MPGTFVFKPIEAKLTHDTDLVGQMNPYCSFSAGHYKNRGEVAQKGGKHPQWNDSVRVAVPSSSISTINLEVMDKEYNDVLMMQDDLIGSCSINLDEIESQGSMKKWFPLSFKSKPAGEILMEASFEDEGKNFSDSGMSLLKPSTLSQPEKKSPRLSASKTVAPKKSPIVDKKAPVSSSITKTTIITEEPVSKLASSSLKREEELLMSHPVTLINEDIMDLAEKRSIRTFTEQNQIIEPHTFLKEVETVEIVPHTTQITVMEPRVVLKDVEYTMLVPVTKTYDIVEPRVITREVDAVEEQVVKRYIKVIENVPVKKMVEVIEMVKKFKEVEVYETRTFTKQIEVTEQVPVQKIVEVSEPVTVSKTVEFIEPVVTTQTIVKEIFEPMVIAEKFTQEVGPATLLTVEESKGLRLLEKESLAKLEKESTDKIIIVETEKIIPVVTKKTNKTNKKF